jgi:hypothetical protein
MTGTRYITVILHSVTLLITLLTYFEIQLVHCLKVLYLTSLVLSRPLLRLLLGDIGFVHPVISMVVIGPSLPILRRRRWSLLYDVY